MENDIAERLMEYSTIQRIHTWRDEGVLEEKIQTELESKHLRLAHKMTSGPAKRITDDQLQELHELEVARAYLTILSLTNDHDQNKMRRAMNGEMIDGSPKQSTVLRRMRDAAVHLDNIPEVPVANRRTVSLNFGSGS